MAVSPDTIIQFDIGTFLAIIGASISVLIIGPLAWIVRGLIGDVKELKRTSGEFEKEVNREFVRKTDHVLEMREIKDLLRQIFDKLDGKADK